MSNKRQCIQCISWASDWDIFGHLTCFVINTHTRLLHSHYPGTLNMQNDLIGLWYKNNRFMKMQGLCCCCNNNKHAAEVMGESWVKDMLITGLKWKTNSCLHVRCFWATYLTQSSVAVWPRVNICTMKVNYNKILYSFKNKNNKVLLTSMIMITMILVNDCSVLRIV